MPPQAVGGPRVFRRDVSFLWSVLSALLWHLLVTFNVILLLIVGVTEGEGIVKLVESPLYIPGKRDPGLQPIPTLHTICDHASYLVHHHRGMYQSSSCAADLAVCAVGSNATEPICVMIDQVYSL